LNETKAAELGRSVHHWLEFQVACRQEMLLSEAYLAQPTGEFLRAQHTEEIKAEWTIPGLKTGKRGRPKQLDYVLLSRNKGRLTTAIEAKWVRSTQGETQRVVDDLLRLERIRSGVTGQSVDRYFLVASRVDDFQSNFLDLQVQDQGLKPFLPPLLNVNNATPKQVRIDTSTGPWRGFFKTFGESYEVTLPKSFTSKLIVDVPGSAIRLALWRVSSSQNRSQIHASTLL